VTHGRCMPLTYQDDHAGKLVRFDQGLMTAAAKCNVVAICQWHAVRLTYSSMVPFSFVRSNHKISVPSDFRSN